MSNNNNIRQPLNLYSIFGYLLPGFFLITLFILDRDGSTLINEYWLNENSLDLSAINELNLKSKSLLNLFSSGKFSDFKIIPFIIFLLFCYLIGHIISAISSMIIERKFVRNLFGFPSENLLSGKSNKKSKLPFRNYKKSLRKEMIEEIKNTSEKVFDFHANKSDYYWLFYSYIISRRPYLAPRVHHFVNLYGFSRNVCATFIIYVLARLILLGCIIGIEIDKATLIILSVFIISSFFMFWNYLKLFKRQAVDVYFLFLSISHEELEKTDKN